MAKKKESLEGMSLQRKAKNEFKCSKKCLEREVKVTDI